VRTMADEPLSKTWEEKEAEARKLLDDELVTRWQHYHHVAWRMISQEGRESYDPVEVRHFAEMLLLLDIARGGDAFSRFRARYGGTTLRLVKFEGEGQAELWINPEAVGSLISSLTVDREPCVLINLIGGTAYVVRGSIPDTMAKLGTERTGAHFGGEY
jgi:hypothetical protein